MREARALQDRREDTKSRYPAAPHVRGWVSLIYPESEHGLPCVWGPLTIDDFYLQSYTFVVPYGFF